MRHRLARAVAIGAALLSGAPASAADKTWDNGGGANTKWTAGANWDADTAPSPADALFFAGAPAAPLDNDFAAGTRFDGITFNAGAGAFTLNGNAILLGGPTVLRTLVPPTPIIVGVTNASANLQTVNLGLTLSAGNHTFGGGTGGLVLNGGFTRGPGSIAIFTPGAGGITVPTLTNTNGILGGWATVGGDWATKNASNQIVAYTGYTTLTGTPTIASDATSNVRITSGTTGNTMLAAAGTTDVNTVQLTDTLRRDLIIGAGNTLRLGPKGAIFRSDVTGTGTANVTMAIGAVANEGTLTAGGAADTAGELIINSGSNSPNNGAINILSTITDNGTGVVTLIKTGFGPASLQGTNTYTGGTYIPEGRLQGGTASSYGPGTITVVGTGQAFLGNVTYANNFFIAGNGTSENDGIGAIRISGATLTGTITLIGNARIATRSNNTGTITGPITGPFSLELGGYNNDQNSIIAVGNTNNDYTGNTTLSQNSTVRLNASEVIPHGVGKGNLIFNVNAGAARSTILDLNGFNETINGLSRIGSTGIRAIIRNSLASTTSTLTVGGNAQTSTFDGIIQDNGGTVAITKIESGTLTLGGANAYTGATNINGGVLSVTGSLSIGSPVNINTSPTSAGTLSGNGASLLVGPVTLAANNGTNIARINPGPTAAAGSVGRIEMDSLTVNGGDLRFDLITNTTPGTTSDFIQVTQGVNFAAASTISLSSVAPAVGTYTLLTAGSITYGVAPTLDTSAVGGTTRSTYMLDTVSTPGSILLTVGGGGKAITWTGTNGSAWDINATQNWTDGAIPEKYFNGDTVTFGDGPTNRNLTLNVTVSPAAITFNNGSNYSISGIGSIAGGATLTKSGAGSLVLATNNSYSGATTINEGTVQAGAGGTTGSIGNGPVSIAAGATLALNRSDTVMVANVIDGAGELRQAGPGILILTGANTYTGPTTIAGGTLRITTNASLGALPGGAVTIQAGGTLDLTGNPTANNANYGAKQIRVAGAGVNSAGAIINNGVNQQNAFQNVVLTADATVGGTARFDIRGGTPMLDLAGFTLTKVGTNQFTLVGTTVSAGNVVVNQGLFSIETTSTVGAGGTITYNTGTSAQFFQNASPSTVTRQMIFNGAGIQVGNAGGNPATIGSPMTMQGDVTFTNLNNSTGSLRLTGAIGEAGGARSLTKTGATTLFLDGVNTYTGATLVNAGVVVVNGSLAAGSAVTVNGATTTSAALGGGVGTVEGVVNGPVTVTRGYLSPGSNGAVATIAANVGTAPASVNVGILRVGSVNASGAEATLYMDLSGAGDATGGSAGTTYDQLIIASTSLFNPNGATLLLNEPAGFAAVENDAYTIVRHFGPNGEGFNIGGTVLTENSTFVDPNNAAVTYRINYHVPGVGGGENIVLSVVPEPASLGLLGVGLALGLRRRRRSTVLDANSPRRGGGL